MGVTRRRGAARFIRFTRLPGGGGVLRRLCIRFLPAAVALRFAAFFTFLPASNLRSSRQRTLPQSDSTSSDQRSNRSGETTEQTSKPVPPLDTNAGKVGQCPTTCLA